MADARLVWRELSQTQPNVAPLLGQANDAFNNAADAASGILGRYEAGVKGKNDAEVRQELAAIKDEAGLDKWLAAGGLNGRPVSDDVLGLVSGGRNTIIGYTNDRSLIRDRDGRLVIAQNDGRIRQDVNARAQGDWNWQDGQRRELAGLSGAVVGARTEGQDYGQSAPTQGVQAKVYQGLLARGMPEHIAQGFMMNFQDESGFNIGVEEAASNVHGTRGKGLYQLTGDRRNAFEAKYGNDYSIDNQLDFLMEELGGSESRAWEIIRNSQNAAEAGANIVNNFLRPASEHARSRTAKYVGANGYSIPQAVGTPKRDALEAALAGSQYLSPDQINSLLNTNDGFVQQGVDRQTQERLQRNEDLLAQLTMDAINNPENTTPAQVQQEVASRAEATGLLDSSEVLAGMKGAEGEIASSPGLQAQLAPTVADDVKANEIIENTVKAATGAINATDTNWMFRDAQSYTGDTALDIANQLASNLNLEQTTSNFEVKDLEQKLRKFASDNDISIPEAAAAFARGYEADPAWLRGEDTWHGLGWDLTRNTLDNQFDADVIGGLVSGVSQQSRQKYNEARSSVTVIENELRILQSQITLLRRQAAKARTPAQKANFEAQILALETAQGEVESKLSTAKK